MRLLHSELAQRHALVNNLKKIGLGSGEKRLVRQLVPATTAGGANSAVVLHHCGSAFENLERVESRNAEWLSEKAGIEFPYLPPIQAPTLALIVSVVQAWQDHSCHVKFSEPLLVKYFVLGDGFGSNIENVDALPRIEKAFGLSACELLMSRGAQMIYRPTIEFEGTTFYLPEELRAKEDRLAA